MSYSDSAKKSCVLCGHSCSSAAKLCPNCGQPNPTVPLKSPLEQFKQKLGIIIWSIIGVVFIAWIFAPTDKFDTVLLLGVVVIAIILLFEYLADFLNFLVNWKKNLGSILASPLILWAWISLMDKNFAHFFLLSILSIAVMIAVHKYFDKN